MSIAPIQVKDQLVATKNKTRKGKGILYQKQQALIIPSVKQIHTIICNPAPPTTALTNTSPFSFYLERNQFRILHTLTLRMKVTVSTNPVYLAPTPLWFERIEVILRKNSVEIARYHDVNLFSNIGFLGNDKVEQMKEMINIDSESFGYKQTPVGASVSKYFYLPLIGTVFSGSGIDMGIVNSDIELRFYPRSPIVSGSGTMTIDEMAAMIETETPDAQSDAINRQIMSKNIINFNYLQTATYQEPTRSYAVSTKYDVYLDAFNNRSAMIFFGMRASQANTSQASLKFIDLGNSTVDILSTSGKSLLAGGRPIPVNYLNNVIVQKYAKSNMFKHNNIYCIPFTNLNQALFKGIMDRFHNFAGDKQVLSITTDAAAVSQVQTITTSAAATSGKFKLGFRGAWTADLAYDASVSALKTAFDALPTAAKHGITSTFVGTADAGTSITVTLVKRGQAFENEDLVAVDTEGLLATAAAVECSSVAITTAYKQGFTAGSYVLDVWSYFYQALSQDGPELTVFKY